MIEVLSFEKGVRYDSADAAGPEEALVAARTLLSDYLSDTRHRRSLFTVGFFVGGKLVRYATPQDLCPLATPAT